MYICGLILFCTIFIYDFFGFDFLVFLCLIFWVCMIFFGFVFFCVLDEEGVRSKFMRFFVVVVVVVVVVVKIDKLIFKILS